MKLTSEYASIEVPSPILVGASPLALDDDRVKRLVDAGVGGFVMPSIFEEQILESNLRRFRGTTTTINSVGANLDRYNGGTEQYLRSIEATRRISRVPVFASFDCVSTNGWDDYASAVRDAGADALELNLYHYESDPHRFAEDIERDLIERASAFCAAAGLPVSVKLLPQFTCLPNIVFRLGGAGAKSVCLFGQTPVLDAHQRRGVRYRWRFTTPSDLRVTLEAVHQAHQATHNVSVAASGGISTPEDALSAIRMGAAVVMITSAIYKRGCPAVTAIRAALLSELESRNMDNVRELIGCQGGGFDPFPTCSHREAYSSSIAEFAENA